MPSQFRVPDPRSRHSGQNLEQIREVSVVLAGILLFAVFIHYRSGLRLLAFAGLAGASLMIAFSTRRISLTEAAGLQKPGRRVLFFSLPAATLGILLGIAVRNRFGEALLPDSAGTFILVAPLIGIMEELVFRGYMQGSLLPAGRIFSILSATLAHTLYKLVLIYFYPGPLQFDLLFLALWTFAGGLAFGLLRDLSRNSIPPVLAHALFDIVLYGGLNAAPAWVWT
jgi:membrane protease YdiL (CAAX protease family)